MTKLDEFYLAQKEPIQSCLIALKDVIISYDKQAITQRWYYRLPCFFYNGKMFCYIWINKKNNLPYIAFYPGKKLEHPLLEQGNRTHSKSITINPIKDIPVTTIYEIIDEALNKS